MTIDLAALPVRSPAQLRSFVAGQRVGALRRPSDVAEANPPEDSGDDYWRFLRRRAALEGTCLLYQTYDASGDENDWNLNIAPDAAHAWMLDPGLLVALAAASGSSEPIDLGEIKRFHGVPVIECELSPDDARPRRIRRERVADRSGRSRRGWRREPRPGTDLRRRGRLWRVLWRLRPRWPP